MAGNASNWFKVITGGVKKRVYSDTATLAEMIYTGRESRHALTSEDLKYVLATTRVSQ